MIDPARLLAMPPIETRHTLTRRDTILYALGIGATELPFVFEEQLLALPTMAVVLAYPGFFWRNPDYGADWRRILHGEQSILLHRPLPVEGGFVGRTRIRSVQDKGEKGAIVLASREITDESGAPCATVAMTAFLRGDGGCGSAGEPLPPPRPTPGDRAPDMTVTLPTAPNQALIYRLSGDDNPLHVDPEVARAAGFERPILHGLCTYGVASRAILSALCGNDPTRLKRLDARFSAPVYPGETIETRIWRDGESRAAFQSRAVERDLIVLTNGYAEF